MGRMSKRPHKPTHSPQAVQDNLAVPNWPFFKRTIVKIFEEVRRDCTGGKPADYIPILAKADPSKFGLSVCTVDGQRFDYGDFDQEFSIQYVSSPLPAPQIRPPLPGFTLCLCSDRV